MFTKNVTDVHMTLGSSRQDMLHVYFICRALELMVAC